MIIVANIFLFILTIVTWLIFISLIIVLKDLKSTSDWLKTAVSFATTMGILYITNSNMQIFF